MTEKEKVLTPITDRAEVGTCHEARYYLGEEWESVVDAKVARELEGMCEELAAELKYGRPNGEPLSMLGETDKYVIAYQQWWHKSGDTLARYQQLKEESK